ncbi:TPA: hypothetical protein ACYSE6_006606 [Pseudomonas aeruginosa]
MNDVQSVIHPSYVTWLAVPLALYAFYHAIRVGRIAVKRFQYRNHTFSDPALQRAFEALPPRPIWRDALFALLYALMGFLVLLGLADLHWNFL